MLSSAGFACSDQGRERARNEDSFRIDEPLQLYVVCDGMGGHKSGDVASRLACDTIVGEMTERAGLVRRARKRSGRTPELESALEGAVAEACRVVWAAAKADPNNAGMGSTATALLCVGRKAVMAHVGDSRLYLLRGDEVHQLSADHTIAAELATAGVLSWDKVPKHPYAHVLTRAIGQQRSVQVDTLVIDLLPGDRFMLCSDGLADYIPAPEWLRRSLGDGVAASIPEKLVDFANDSGGKDNVTVVVVDVQGVGQDEVTLREVTTSVHAKLHSLTSIFLFDGLELSQLARVLEVADVVDHFPGAEVFAQGSDRAELRIVIDGRFELVRDGAVVGEIGAGAEVSASTLLAPRTARAGLRCVEPGRTLSISREHFRDLAHKRPWLGVALLERLGSHIAAQLDAPAAADPTRQV